MTGWGRQGAPERPRWLSCPGAVSWSATMDILQHEDLFRADGDDGNRAPDPAARGERLSVGSGGSGPRRSGSRSDPRPCWRRRPPIRPPRRTGGPAGWRRGPTASPRQDRTRQRVQGRGHQLPSVTVPPSLGGQVDGVHLAHPGSLRVPIRVGIGEVHHLSCGLVDQQRFTVVVAALGVAAPARSPHLEIESVEELLWEAAGVGGLPGADVARPDRSGVVHFGGGDSSRFRCHASTLPIMETAGNRPPFSPPADNRRCGVSVPRRVVFDDVVASRLIGGRTGSVSPQPGAGDLPRGCGSHCWRCVPVEVGTFADLGCVGRSGTVRIN